MLVQIYFHFIILNGTQQTVCFFTTEGFKEANGCFLFRSLQFHCFSLRTFKGYLEPQQALLNPPLQRYIPLPFTAFRQRSRHLLNTAPDTNICSLPSCASQCFPSFSIHLNSHLLSEAVPDHSLTNCN